MDNKYLKLPLFLILAWIFAFIYEEIPRTILRSLPGVLHLWELNPDGLATFPLIFFGIIFFLLWYGILFLIFYFIFINKNIKYPVIFGILYGIIFETFYFKKMENIFSFIIFVLLYFGMFYFPFKITKIIYNKEKIKKSELLIVIISQLTALAILFLAFWAS